jgi:hypothetical protein
MELGQTVSRAVERAFVGRAPLRIETLRVKLPAGASSRDIERALRREIERKAGRLG